MTTSRILASATSVGLLVFLVVLGLRALSPGGIIAVAPQPPSLIPAQKVDVPAGWIVMDQAPRFSLRAPRGTVHHTKPGIDWEGGQFDGPDFSFGYYIGWAPQGLHQAGDPAFTERPVVIDGRGGTLQRYVYPAGGAKDGRRYYSRLLLRNVFKRYDYGDSKPALDLYGRAATPQAQADMERMWRSIRFDGRQVKDLAPMHGGL